MSGTHFVLVWFALLFFVAGLLYCVSASLCRNSCWDGKGVREHGANTDRWLVGRDIICLIARACVLCHASCRETGM